MHIVSLKYARRSGKHMRNTEYEIIEIRFSSSYSTDFKTVEKTSTFLKMTPDTSVPSNPEDHYIVVPPEVFELFVSLIENGKIASVNSISATLKDGSVLCSDEGLEA